MRVYLWGYVPGEAAKFAKGEAKTLPLNIEVLPTTDLTSSIAAANRTEADQFSLLVNVEYGYSEAWKTAAEALLQTLPRTGWAILGAAGYSPLAGIVDAASVNYKFNGVSSSDAILPLSNVEPHLLLLNKAELQRVNLTPATRTNADSTRLSFEVLSSGKAILWAASFGIGGIPIRRIHAVGRFAGADMDWVASRSRTTLVKTARRDYLIRHSAAADPLATGFDVERESVRLTASVLGGERSLKIALVFEAEPNPAERNRLDITRRALEIAAGNIETSVLTSESFSKSNSEFDWSIAMPKGSWVMSQAASSLTGALLGGSGYSRVTFGTIGVLEMRGANTGNNITDHRFAKPAKLESGATVFRVSLASVGSFDAAPPVRVSLPLLISPSPELSLAEAAGILGIEAKDLKSGAEVQINHEVAIITWLRTLGQLVRDENNYRRAMRIFNRGDLRRLQQKLLKSKRVTNQGGVNQ
jgi:hypothetical protein